MGTLDRLASNARAERVFLTLLRAFAEQGRRVNAAGGQAYAPSAFAAHPGAEGIGRRGFADAMERLLRAGRIRSVESGPPSRGRAHLEAVS